MEIPRNDTRQLADLLVEGNPWFTAKREFWLALAAGLQDRLDEIEAQECLPPEDHAHAFRTDLEHPFSINLDGKAVSLHGDLRCGCGSVPPPAYAHGYTCEYCTPNESGVRPRWEHEGDYKLHMRIVHYGLPNQPPMADWATHTHKEMAQGGHAVMITGVNPGVSVTVQNDWSDPCYDCIDSEPQDDPYRRCEAHKRG